MVANPEIMTEIGGPLGENDSVRQLLHAGNTDGITGTLIPICDANGTATGLFISTTHIGSDYFDLTAGRTNPAHKEGRIYYDDDEKCPTYLNNTSAVAHQIGREFWKRATNKTGITIPDGTLVYVSGAQGNRATMAPAKADVPGTSRMMAMATHDIEDNMTGEFTTGGEVHGLNTDGLGAGTPLYLSATTAGEWTATAPTAPNFPIAVGLVTRESVNEGIIDLSIGPTDVVAAMVIQTLALNAQLNLQEMTTPTAIDNYGAVYPKADNKLYFQDGAGVEHEVAFV